MADILVLGAGMIGVSTALALQSHGHAVTVIDRTSPGQETSYGNAGIIQTEAAEPYALPRDLGTLVSMTLGRSNDVMWSLRGVMEMAPALWSYFRNSAPRRHREISEAYAPLIARATADHVPLIAASGAEDLIQREGLSLVYRDAKSFDAAAADAERAARLFDLELRVVDGARYRAEDPAFKATPSGALHWHASWSCSAPGALVQAYATLFEDRGGRVLVGEANSLRQTATGWCVATQDGMVDATDAVIALGPWSPAVLRAFGYRIPMVYKRGYHGHFETKVAPKRPFLDVCNGVLAAPMQAGLRIATGAALVTKDSPVDTRQLTRGAAGLSDLIDIGARIDEPQWVGTRPCMPDMLPMVGAAPHHRGLWFNFGHGHQGFTLGPTTGAILAMLLAGEPQEAAHALSPAHRLRGPGEGRNGYAR